MPRSYSFGDLVVPSGDDATSGLWIVAEVRRADCRVVQPATGRSLWTPLAGLRQARQEESWGTIEVLIAELLAMLRAVELEFTPLDGGRARLVATHGALRPETLDAVRERLGDRLSLAVVRPAGMHRLQTLLEFSTR